MPKKRDSKAGNGLLLTLFQAAFGLLIAFLANLEGFVIEIKSVAPVAEDNIVSLKA